MSLLFSMGDCALEITLRAAWLSRKASLPTHSEVMK